MSLATAIKQHSFSQITKAVLLLILWSLVSVDCEPCLILDYNETECISTPEAINSSIIHPGCQDSVQHKPYIYSFMSSFNCLNDIVHMLDLALSATAVSNYCNQLLRGYFCNYVYLGCNPSNNHPIGICYDNCVEYIFDEYCSDEISGLVNLALSFDGFDFVRQCNNTLMFLEDSGFVIDVNVTQDHTCNDISGLITATIPNGVVAAISTQPMLSASTVSLETILFPLCITTAILIIATVGSIALILLKRRKKRRRRLLDFSSGGQQSSISNYYHSGSTLTQQDPAHIYDEVPLFQLSLEDVNFQENPTLQDAMIPFNQLTIMEEIGQGAFGCVFKGLITWPSEDRGEEVAVKTIKNSTGSYTELKGFIEESMLMHSFHHPNVLGLVGVSLDHSNSPYLLVPYMDNGDLKSYLKKIRETVKLLDTGYPEGLDDILLLKMCSEIAMGMEYLAHHKLVHRDLAARNCMVDKALVVRVADFGLTRDIYETNYYRQQQTGRIPIKWMAPESLNDRISNEKTDVWSFGVTCWEVFSLGKTPYPTVSNVDMLDYLEEGHRLRQPALCPDEMFIFVKSCWIDKPEHRPSFSSITATMASFLPKPNDPAANTWGELSDTPLFATEANDDDSLFDSIVGMLPTSFQKSLRGEQCLHRSHMTNTPPPTDVQLSDTYTVMNPVAVKSPKQRPDYYNQVHTSNGKKKGKVKLSYTNPLQRARSQRYTRDSSLQPHKETVSRSPSTVSDYINMFPAEPATPS